MRFEWDEAKNHSNLKKHGIEFKAAVLVFEDPCQFVEGLIVMVAHTWQEEDGEEVVRIISSSKGELA
jgi:uncharacterized DUF497 family protein